MSDLMMQLQCWEPVQAHNAITKSLWPWVKAQNVAGRRVTVECRLTEDVKTDGQRRYYHGIVLAEIAKQATVNGQRFPLAVWKEWFRDQYLGYKSVSCINPMTGKKSRRRVRKSTEDLGVKGYAALIERVTAFAVTELSVKFPESRPEQWVDGDTGEIHGK